MPNELTTLFREKNPSSKLSDTQITRLYFDRYGRSNLGQYPQALQDYDSNPYGTPPTAPGGPPALSIEAQQRLIQPEPDEPVYPKSTWGEATGRFRTAAGAIPEMLGGAVGLGLESTIGVGGIHSRGHP